jgi:CheY-like chemotaxis protein
MSDAGVEYLNLAAAVQRGLHVLVVDDHPANRMVLSFMLEQIRAKATCAENGAEAVDAYGRDRFGLVLMDLRMPVMDGFEAMKRIRAAESRTGKARTPIIVQSAHTTPMDAARAREAGADDHLGKPLHIPALLAAMDAALAGGEAAAAASA